ncbi:choice-of-anchor tandem repeat GloVer-containing protein [Methyloglobulus sp.]|uniref:choice-of-anchor tandem repeat GloVer-containing protein n=1 Tax=Methyloglobulus sp. TaxID=2518622 RepID=UPI0032B741D1
MQHIKPSFFKKLQVSLSMILMLCIFPPIATAAAPEVELLKSFGKLEGHPNSKLIQDAAGNLYGTTLYGGSYGFGAVYKIDASGSYSVLYSFDRINGAGLTSLIQGNDGKFYGITLNISEVYSEPCIGVSHDAGTVFQLDISGTKPVHKILHDFDCRGSPSPDLIQASNGKFYGTTTSGGRNGAGTVFQLDTSGASPAFSVLHDFDQGVASTALFQGSDGKLYGATFQGYRTLLYQLNITGATPVYTLMYTVNLNYRQDPDSFIQGSDGKFYGIFTEYFNGSQSVLFQLDTSGATPVYTILHEFPFLMGGSDLIQGRDGKLYGTTRNCSVFQVDLSSATPSYSILHEIKGCRHGDNLIGGLTQGKGGTLYGYTITNNYPLINGTSTVFQLALSGATPSYSLLHEFAATQAVLPVVQGSDGNFYGTTIQHGYGSPMFQLGNSGSASASTLQPIFDLFSKQELSSLFKGNDGKFYGITTKGGSFDLGTVFQLDTSRSMPIYRILYEFTLENSTGRNPNNLIQGRDGKLYGTTDGSNASRIVFQLDISGAKPTIKVLHVFDEFDYDIDKGTGTWITSPYGLAQGSDGKLYGITYGDGIFGYGTVFQLDITGVTPVYTTLHVFGVTDGDGIHPTYFIQGSDSKLYGTTQDGGGISLGGGTVFQIDTAGVIPTYTVLHVFGDDGYSPSSLIQGGDGKLYGTTKAGKSIFFQLDISATTPLYTVLYEYKHNSNVGLYPSGLVLGSGGNFYGYTRDGGLYGRGAIYQIRMPTINTPPLAANDSYALVAPKNNKTITVAAPGVLKNDKDGEGDKLTVVGATMSAPKLIELPKGGGKVALYADGHFNYTSARKRFNGTTSFCYQVTDGQATSNPATVTLTVHCKDSGHKHKKARRHKGED